MVLGMPTKLIPGTSLFVTLFISAIVTILHAFNYGSIDLVLVVPLILGSIFGVQIGQKIGQYLKSSELKTLFAILLCSVSVAIAYDTFFKESSEEVSEANVLQASLNPFSEFVLNLSNDTPMLYGAFAIIIAIALGIFASLLRKLLTNVLLERSGDLFF